MVTVATSLDVPIKLVFPGPKRGSMLGLGDVVLPGIMMALALRFDLYLHYLRKRLSNSAISVKDSKVSQDPMPKIFKAPYQEATGTWGERFWTRSAPIEDKPASASGGRFSKVYFKASLVGYIVGMLFTLVVLNVYNHPQPALLYLVPGVLIALWSTALVRRELPLMWNYTEDGSLDDDGKPDEKNKLKDSGEQTEGKCGANATVVDTKKTDKEEMKDDQAHYVFFFSLSSPRQGPKKARLLGES